MLVGKLGIWENRKGSDFCGYGFNIFLKVESEWLGIGDVSQCHLRTIAGVLVAPIVVASGKANNNIGWRSDVFPRSLRKA